MGHQNRVRKIQINKTSAVAPMYLAVKDHKKVEESKLPKTRPIVFGCLCMEVYLAKDQSDIVEILPNIIAFPMESVGSEDQVALLNNYHKKIGLEVNYTKEYMVILGVNVIALFASLNTDEVVREVKLEIMERNMKFEGVNCT